MNTYLAVMWKTRDHARIEQGALRPYLLRKPTRAGVWFSPSGQVELHCFEYWPELILPQGHFFQRQGEALCFDGFPDSGSDASMTTAEKCEEGLFETARLDMLRFQGEFSVVHATDQWLRVFLNRNGSHPIYYVDEPGYIAFSNRLPLLLMLPGISRELNPEAAAWLVYQGFTQCNVTAFKAVHKLSCGTLATATADGQLRLRPTTYQDMVSVYDVDPAPAPLKRVFEGHCEELIGYVQRMHQFYGGLGMTLRLSGGKDSRVALGLLMRAGLTGAITDSYTTGMLYAPDVLSAQDIAARSGLQERHRVVRDTRVHDELRLNMHVLVESLNVTAGQLSIHDFSRVPEHEERILVTGHQGLRDTWFRHCPTNSLKQFADAMFSTYFHDPLGLLGEKERPRFLKRYLERFERFHVEEQAPLDVVAELHAIREVQGTWAAAINVATHLAGPMCSPLLHPRVACLTLAMPKRFRKNEMYHFMALATLAPELLDIPFANQQWFPDLREVLAGAIDVPVVPPYKSSKHFPSFSNPFLPPAKIAYYNTLKPHMAQLAERHRELLTPTLSLDRIREAMRINPEVQAPELVCGMGLYTMLMLAEHGVELFHQERTGTVAEHLNDVATERVIVATQSGAAPERLDGETSWRGIHASVEGLEPGQEGKASGAIRCRTSAQLWAGATWGADELGKPRLVCQPGTPYALVLRLRGEDQFEQVRLHVAVYDQDERQLCNPAFPLTADFRKYTVNFSTDMRSTHLRVNLVKARSDALVTFQERELQIHPVAVSHDELHQRLIERCEKGIAGLVRELQALQAASPEGLTSIPTTRKNWRHIHIRNLNPKAHTFYVKVRKGWFGKGPPSPLIEIPCGEVFTWGVMADHADKVIVCCDAIKMRRKLTIKETVQSYHMVISR